MRKAAIAIVAVAIVMAVVTASSAALTPTATMDISADGMKLFGVLGNPVIGYGEYIKVKVKVSNTGQIPFTPKIRLLITDPDAKYYDQWYGDDEDLGTLDPGQSKEWTFETGVQANKVGSWYLTAELWDKNTNQRLAHDSSWFDVVEQKGTIEIENITGYALTSLGIIAAAYYGIRKYYGVA